VIKDMGGSTFYQGQTLGEAIKSLQANPDAPEIVYIEADIPDAQMPSLYTACDCLVHPYRGEGFGIPILEAMACGLPVIVTAGGASDDFVDDASAWRIAAKKLSLGNVVDGRPLAAEGWMLEPDAEALRSAMTYAAANPVEGKLRGMIGSARARSAWTWQHATAKLSQRIAALTATAPRSIPLPAPDSSLFYALAETALVAENGDEAVSSYTKALGAPMLSEEIYVRIIARLAQISLAEGNPGDAAEVLAQVPESGSDAYDVRYLRAAAAGIARDYDEALAILGPLLNEWNDMRNATRLDLTQADLLCDVGDCFYGLGEFEDARSVYEHCLEAYPETARACFGVGRVFDAAGFPDEAAKMYGWAAKLDPDYTVVATKAAVAAEAA
jgi:tetratricopeptide (TPR) repeat protein